MKTFVTIVLLSCTATLLAKQHTFTPHELRVVKEMGASITQDSKILLDGIMLDPISKEISFDAQTAITDDILEVLITSPGGRTHETLLHTNIDPFKLQLLLYLSGGRNGPRKDATHNQYRIEIAPIGGGRRSVEEWISRYTEDKHIPPRTWSFVGSSFSEGKECLAKREGNVVLLWDNGQTIFNNPNDDGDLGNAFQPFQPNFPPDAFTRPIAVRVYLVPVTIQK